MKNPLLKTLFLPCALCCVSANVDEVGYTFRYGPFIRGEGANIELRFLPSRFPNVTHFFVDALDKENPSWHYVYTPPTSTLPKGSDGWITATALLPGDVMKLNHSITLVFGLSRGTYYKGMNFSNIFLRVEDYPKVRYESGLLLFISDESYECNREVALYDPRIDASKTVYYRDGYYVEGMRLGEDLSSRRVPLNQTHLYYTNPYGTPRQNFNIEMRFSSFMDDFLGVGVSHGGYVSVPLTGKWSKYRTGVYRYDITGSKDILYYSRIDYRMFSSPPDEPYFSSRNIYLPLREGHDAGDYRYMYFLDNVGEFGDQVMLYDDVYSSVAKFGPCTSAEYCVVIG